MDERLSYVVWLTAEYALKSLQEIADDLGVSRNTVRNRCVAFGIERRGAGDYMRGREKPASQRAKMSEARKAAWRSADRAAIGQNISRGKGGTGVPAGYVYDRLPSGQKVRQHRRRMEQALGRTLLPAEIVHHIDGNPRNNSIDNLQVMEHGAHTRLHHLKGKSLNCAACGTEFYVKDSQAGSRKACSRRCQGLLWQAAVVEKSCPGCRLAFSVLASQSRRRTFCSHSCATSYHNFRRVG